MAQVTIYLDDETEKAARAAAAAAHLPLSRWFAQFAERESARKRSDWDDFFSKVDEHSALWARMPLTEELHRDQPPDTPRETW